YRPVNQSSQLSQHVTFRPVKCPSEVREKEIMKTKLFVAMLLAGSSMFAATHVSIGIGVGGYGNGYRAAPPPPVVAYAPPRPGPGYTWVDGYWDQVGPRRSWRSGYWAAPSYRSGYRVERLNENNRHESDVRNGNGNYVGNRYG